jgi:vanillate O-demethylase ferredoxin subunit
MNNLLELVVHRAWNDGEGVRLFDLRLKNQDTLPRFTAGANIGVHINDDLVRHYSLCNNPKESYRYIIAVAKAADSKGGSLWMHQHLKEGETISISPPQNHFSLDESSAYSILVAGGIGITPMLAMMMSLEEQGKKWELHFVSRDKNRAPLLSQIIVMQNSLKFGIIHLYFSRAVPSSRLDLPAIISRASKDSHFYCCGPKSLLNDYIKCLEHVSSEKVHLEHFHSEQTAANQGKFTIVLARSGMEIDVNQGQTVLDVLKKHSINISYACGEGVCGSCEVQVLEGLPDHRDNVLSDTEKDENKSMMVCCSGSISDRLILDL